MWTRIYEIDRIRGMKIFTRIFNIIYLALAAFALAMMATQPFIAVEASVSLPKEQITELVYPSVSERITEDQWNTAIGKIEGDNITVGLSVSVPTADIIDYKNGANTTNSIVGSISESGMNILKTLKPVVGTLIETMVVEIAADAVHDGIWNEIENNSSEFGVNPDEAMLSAGITDEYIHEFAQSLLDVAMGKEPSPRGDDLILISDVMLKVSTFNRDICNKLKEANVTPFNIVPPEKLEEYCESMDADVEATLEKNLVKATVAKKCEKAGFESEYEIVKFDLIINRLIIAILNKINGDDSDLNSIMNYANSSVEEAENEGSETTRPATRLLLKEEAEVPAKAGATDQEVEDKLVEVLTNKLGVVTEVFEKYGLYVFTFLLVLMAPWALFALLTIIRTFRKRKCWTKVWFVFLLSVIQLVLGAGLFLLTTKFIPMLANFVPEGLIRTIVTSSSFSIKTSSLIPSFIYLAFIPLTIVYMIVRHKAKKEFKQYKKDKKAAKKAA